MRGFFDEQLELLNTQLIEMGTLIEHSIRSAAEALVSQDIAQAKEAMRFDKKVDEKEREIEENASRFDLLPGLLAEKEELEAKLDEKTERWVYLNELAEKIEQTRLEQ